MGVDNEIVKKIIWSMKIRVNMRILLVEYYKAHTHYQLNEREFKATYITIPLILKLKTKGMSGTPA